MAADKERFFMASIATGQGARDKIAPITAQRARDKELGPLMEPTEEKVSKEVVDGLEPSTASQDALVKEGPQEEFEDCVERPMALPPVETLQRNGSSASSEGLEPPETITTVVVPAEFASVETGADPAMGPFQ